MPDTCCKKRNDIQWDSVMASPLDDQNDRPLALPLVCCVVVNWNGWRDTLECLTSLQQQEYENLEVIVVDNGSTDDSCRKIREAHPWVSLVETGRNLGFATGCNTGTRLACERGADFVWLLNNDTVASRDTVAELVQTALSNSRVGAIGTVLYYCLDPHKVQAWGGGRINLWTGYNLHFKNRAIFDRGTYFTGASVLLPRPICQEVGIFYEGFFMYGEDSDLSLRIRQAGYDLVMAEGTCVLHKEGASSPKRSALIDQYATVSMMRLLERQAPLPALSITIYLTLRSGNRLFRREWPNLTAVWAGVAVYWRERKLRFSERL
jgi:GT2 family glycosyltransferase